MTIAAFICTAVVAAIIGGLSVAAKHSTNIFDFAFKLLAPLACLVLALVSGNLASALGGYTIFIALGMALILAEEAFKCVHGEDTNKSSVLFMGITNMLSYACFACGAALVVPFKVWGLLAGLMLGLAAACILMCVKKLTITQWLVTAGNIALCGAALGQGIALLASHSNLITSVLFFIGAAFAFFQVIFSLFTKRDRTMQIIGSVAQVLSLLLISGSIYFLI